MEAPSLPARLRRKVTTRHGWLGDYNYKALCLPRVPFLSPGAPAPFFGLNESLPIAVGALVGFQHALAMIGGITALPLILSGAGDNHLNLDNDFRMLGGGGGAPRGKVQEEARRVASGGGAGCVATAWCRRRLLVRLC